MTQWVSWRRQPVLAMVEGEPDSSRETSADKLIDKSLLRSIKI